MGAQNDGLQTQMAVMSMENVSGLAATGWRVAPTLGLPAAAITRCDATTSPPPAAPTARARAPQAPAGMR